MYRKVLFIGALFVGLLTISTYLNLPAAQSQIRHDPHVAPTNAMYHWKATFEPTAEELDFIVRNDITRLYIKMFDVDVVIDYDTYNAIVEPIATTTFKAPIPEGVEVVPTVYITHVALNKMERREEDYAQRITDRILAMASYNNLGEVREVQFDCDWTARSRNSYFTLCRHAQRMLHEQGIEMSATIRLHQLDEAVPPVDRGVLMLYNTGDIYSVDTENSILDVDDVKPYLQRVSGYELPLDYAYPTFGWSVCFYQSEFDRLVSDSEYEPQFDWEVVRNERPTVQTILEVKRMVEASLGKPYRNNILYHLDETQTKYYTEDEIAEILARN